MFDSRLAETAKTILEQEAKAKQETEEMLTKIERLQNRIKNNRGECFCF